MKNSESVKAREQHLYIVRTLDENPNAKIVKPPEHSISHKENPSTIYYSVRHYVAPAHGLYKADELNEFMRSLVPRLKPNHVYEFSEDKHYGLWLGDIRYDHIVSNEREISRILSMSKKFDQMNGADNARKSAHKNGIERIM